MQFVVTAVLLTVVLGFLREDVKFFLSKSLFDRKARIFLAPLSLSILAYLVAFFQGKPDGVFFILVAAYTFVPTAIIYKVGHGRQNKKYDSRNQTPLDFLVILMLWLPVEYADFSGLLRVYLGDLSHSISWGAAVVLGLFLFLGFRSMPGVKYNLPKRLTDLMIYAVGFVVAAAILIPLARSLSFMNSFRIPTELTVFFVSKTLVVIFVAIALPEELLFRGLIQTWLVNKFGASNKVIILSALIFGLSHIDNYTKLANGTIVFSPPNWSYVLIASVAGIIYGYVFLKSSSITISAALHATVNTVRHSFFG